MTVVSVPGKRCFAVTDVMLLSDAAFFSTKHGSFVVLNLPRRAFNEACNHQNPRLHLRRTARIHSIFPPLGQVKIVCFIQQIAWMSLSGNGFRPPVSEFVLKHSSNCVVIKTRRCCNCRVRCYSPSPWCTDRSGIILYTYVCHSYRTSPVKYEV